MECSGPEGLEGAWKGLERWDVIVMMETLVEMKEWKMIKNRLPGEYKWGFQEAKRSYKKGRARGG